MNAKNLTFHDQVTGYIERKLKWKIINLIWNRKITS